MIKLIKSFWQWWNTEDLTPLIAQRKHAMQILVTLAVEQGADFEYVLPNCTYKGKAVGSWEITVKKLPEGEK